MQKTTRSTQFIDRYEIERMIDRAKALRSRMERAQFAVFMGKVELIGTVSSKAAIG